ncbi:hypothetical protein H0H93_005147, partial [Arthromyces matolae]
MSQQRPRQDQQSTPGPSYPELNYSPGEKWVKHLTQGRINNFHGGRYSDINLSSSLFIHRVDKEENVKLQVWSAPGLSKPTFEEAMKQKFKSARKGDSFGPSWVKHTAAVVSLRTESNIDVDRRTTGGRFPLISLRLGSVTSVYSVRLLVHRSLNNLTLFIHSVEFDPGCEAMIYSTDGTPLQGITGGYGGDRRVEYIIPEAARKEGHHEFVIESSCNGMFGVPWHGDTIDPPDMNRYFSLASADLVVPNQEAWALLWDFTTLRELIDTLPGNTPLQNKAIVAANEIMNVFKRGDPQGIRDARKVAEGVFGEGWESKGEGIYDEGSKNSQIWGIGYGHIVLLNRRSHVRGLRRLISWSDIQNIDSLAVPRNSINGLSKFVVNLLSCALNLKGLRASLQLYPPLFEKVKAKVLEGKFHPVGGSWVENDANMPSGEALVRQFLFGQKYFESRFGKRCDTAWLPDSFGLTGALPQIIRGAGMKYFFTQKLSWNNINVFPHTTFNWVGIDGTQVLCHMTPGPHFLPQILSFFDNFEVDTYTAQATVGDINKGQNNHKNLESSQAALLVFGNGDGGGGPLAKMLENLRRIRAVTNNHRELPPVSMGRSVDEFFEELSDASKGGKTLPNCSTVEPIPPMLLATLACLCKQPNQKYSYPKKRIDDAWEKVLLNQFHDVLPGSAIGMVYEDAEKLYAEIAKDGQAMVEEALHVILPFSVPLDANTNPKSISSSGTIVGFNTTFFRRSDVIQVPLIGAGSALKSQVLQTSNDGTVGYAVMNTPGGASLGTLCTPENGLHAQILPVSAASLSNKDQLAVWFSLRIHQTIGMLGVYPVQLHSNPFIDFALQDVEIHHLESAKQLEFTNVSVVTQGPLRGSVKATTKFDKSTIDVTISLDAIPSTVKNNSRSLFNFEAVVDWRQRHQFLKSIMRHTRHNLDMSSVRLIRIRAGILPSSRSAVI